MRSWKTIQCSASRAVDEPVQNWPKSSLEGKKKFYGLQGADLVSHTFYLAERENEADMDLTPMPEGGNLADAEKALKRKGPIFRNVLGPEQLKQIKESKFAYERARIEFGKRRNQLC